MKSPADVAPDILNHWSSAPEALNVKPQPCLPSEDSVANAFTKDDEPDAKAVHDDTLKELEAREQQRRASLARRGSANGRTRLNEYDVAIIRSMYNIWGLSVAQLAVRFSLPRETVRDIVKRRTWTHI